MIGSGAARGVFLDSVVSKSVTCFGSWLPSAASGWCAEFGGATCSGMAALTAKQIHSILNSGADPSSPELQEALAAAEIELKAELGGRGPGVARLDLNDSAMLRRFLVARKLQVPATVAMLEAHAAWLEQTYPIALPEVPSQPQPATRAQP